MMLGSVIPNFEANTTQGPIKFHDWLGESWGILLSHPADYTPVCTTELTRVAELCPEFAKRGVKVIALSCNSIESHKGWIKDIIQYGVQYGRTVTTPNGDFPFAIIEDESRTLAVTLGMLDPQEKNEKGLPMTCRAVYIVNPEKKVALAILYPATTGRNFDEILRVIDSLQLTANKKVATPVDWKPDDQCMILPSMSEMEAFCTFKHFSGLSLPSGKKYMRFTAHPR